MVPKEFEPLDVLLLFLFIGIYIGNDVCAYLILLHVSRANRSYIDMFIYTCICIIVLHPIGEKSSVTNSLCHTE